MSPRCSWARILDKTGAAGFSVSLARVVIFGGAVQTRSETEVPAYQLPSKRTTRGTRQPAVCIRCGGLAQGCQSDNVSARRLPRLVALLLARSSSRAHR